MEYPTHVPIAQLRIDDSNVRKTGRGAEKSFLGSIRAKGILQPLMVRPNGTGYLVTNGGKRLAALEQLVADGATIAGAPAADYLVPIFVSEMSDAIARDASLTANVITAPMHPVDMHQAFAELIDDGKSEKDLAAHYNMTDREVKQVLALGALSENVLKAWREDKIGAEVAQAFTLATSHKLQDQVLKKVLDGTTDEDLLDQPIEPDEVKDHLKLSSSDIGAMLEFVGAEAYEARGGKVTLDLFGTDHTVSNEKLVNELAIEKLDQLCAQLVSAGWSWAVREETVRDTYGFGRSKPPKQETPTPAEAEKLATLRAKFDHLTWIGDGSIDERRAHAEHAHIEAEIEARGFTAAQKAKAGCFVAIDDTGLAKIEYGRVKPAETKAAAAVDRAAARKEKPKQKTAGEKKPNLQISNNLISELSKQLTHAAAETMVERPHVALPAMIAGLLSSGHAHVISVSQGQHRNRASFAAAFEAASKKDTAGRLEALAAAVGQLVNMHVSHSDRGPLRDAGTLAVCEALGPLLCVNLRKHFDAKGYFTSVNRHIALKQMREMFGKGFQQAWSSEKKAKLEKIAVTKAKEIGWLPPELRTSFYAASMKKRA